MAQVVPARPRFTRRNLILGLLALCGVCTALSMIYSATPAGREATARAAVTSTARAIERAGEATARAATGEAEDAARAVARSTREAEEVAAAVAREATRAAAAEATANAPTATPVPSRTPVPTRTPPPTATLIEGPRVEIAFVNASAEYVDLRNIGNAAQNLSGWRLLSERGNQSCALQGVVGPGETFRIWAQSGEGGFSCGYTENIWNNDDSDPAVLFDASGAEVDRR